ncbi:MAG: 16S rRNA (adenine(1518)-N(6)/adenine(1519)-N(6))-dimethyltransferase RsmA [bacterium]|nr:16S rRNA (adenine(1518)-N(6)/adenine(1519)-N(6))-dimethyltransferase RsmA [bacterium]
MRVKLGQVFLKDKNILKKISSFIEKDKVIFEVGAGKGELTQFLLNAKKLYINEVDSKLISILNSKFSNLENVEVLSGSFLDIDIPKDVQIFTGNLPYYLQKRIILKCLEHDFESAFFLIQKDVAEKIINPPGGRHTTLFTIAVWRIATVEHLFDVSKNSFYPKPQVDGSFVKIKKKDPLFPEVFMNFIKTAFMHRRKKLIKSIPSEFRKEVLSFISENARSEELKIEDWKNLCLLMKQ